MTMMSRLSYCRLSHVIGLIAALTLSSVNAEILNHCSSNPPTKVEIGEHVVDGVSDGSSYHLVTNKGRYLRSTNGKDWTVEYITEDKFPHFRGIAAIEGDLVAVDFDGAIFRKARSDITWQSTTLNNSRKLWQVIKFRKMLVANVPIWRDETTHGVLTSSDAGLSWSFVPLDGEQVLGMRLQRTDKYLFLLSNIVYMSTDGQTWEEFSNSGHRISGLLTENNSQFVNRYGTGEIYVSNDLDQWHEVQSPLQNVNAKDLKVWRNRYISVGKCGHMIMSSDGYQWQLVSTPYLSSDSLELIIPNGNEVLIVGTPKTPDLDGLSIIAYHGRDLDSWERVGAMISQELASFLQKNKNRTLGDIGIKYNSATMGQP
jgi:hypothetical protein